MNGESRPAPRAFFFGVNERAGHHLWERAEELGRQPRLVWANTRRHPLPIQPDRLDGLFSPLGAEVEGIARVAVFDGWTFVAFWDRSGPDKRPGCNSTFILEGEYHNPRLALAIAEQLFPMVWKRFGFTVKLKGD